MIFQKLKPVYAILFILLSLIFSSCNEAEQPKSSLVVKDNLLYKRGSDVPFTGIEKALVEGKILEYEVKDGYKHGFFRIYSEDGIPEIQGQLDSNRNVGKWQYFFPNGEIESEGYFNLDQADGKWIWKYPDGKIKEEGEYDNGTRIGIWLTYDHSGKIINQQNYSLDDSTNNSTE